MWKEGGGGGGGSVLPTLVSSQLFLKKTTKNPPTRTNKTVAARGSVLRWKMRYKIYLRFLVFVKIESSHFNCSRRGVLLQATGNRSSVCRPLFSPHHYFPLCKMPIMVGFILVIYLIYDHLGSHMLQRNSGTPCYYVRLSLPPLIMRTGSQRRNNLSEDSFAGSRPHCVLEEKCGGEFCLFCWFLPNVHLIQSSGR